MKQKESSLQKHIWAILRSSYHALEWNAMRQPLAFENTEQRILNENAKMASTAQNKPEIKLFVYWRTSIFHLAWDLFIIFSFIFSVPL